MARFVRLIRYVRPYWRRLLAALICMAVFAVLSGASLGMIMPFVNVLFDQDGAVANGASVGLLDPGGTVISEEATADDGVSVDDLKERVRARVLSFFVGRSPQSALARVCVALLVVFFARSLFGYLQTFLMITVEQNVIRDLRDGLFRHVSGLSLSFFHSTETGQLISRVTSDIMLVRGAIVASFVNLFRESLLSLIYLGLAVWISWRLSLITLAVFVPVIYIITKVGQRLRKRSVRIQEKMADITSTLQESISGIRVVKAFGMEEYERGRFFAHTREYFRRFVRREALGALAAPLSEYLGVIGVVVVLWYGGREVLAGADISADWFLLFLAAMLSALQPLRRLSRANNQLQIGLAAAGRVFEVLDTPPSIVVRDGAPPLDGFRDRIRYEDVRFDYGTGEQVLRGIDLEVRRGEIVAFVGPSGGGKTTLLDLLPRFYDPVGGRVTIDGHDLRDVDPISLRRLLGIVTQETILFNDTVRNNIAYGMRDADEESVRAAAAAANAAGFIEAMPDGYETVIGERGTRLSGGERQRIAIARAVLKNPPILIFDEATSSLDTESERLVQEAIERLLVGRTVLLIAHRLSTISSSDRIVVVDAGRIVESGTHADLMKRGGLYRRLYDMQFQEPPAGGQSGDE